MTENFLPSQAYSLWAESPKLSLGRIQQPNILPIFERGKDLYQMGENWKVKVFLRNRLVEIMVPYGFVFDGASVPRLLWSVFPPDGLYRAGIVIHDWLYALKGMVRSWSGIWLAFSRDESDEVLHEVMLESGVPQWKAFTIWSFVHLFGWIPWNKPAKKVIIKPLAYKVS